MRGSISIVAGLSLLVSAAALAAGDPDGLQVDGSWRFVSPDLSPGDVFGQSVVTRSGMILIGEPNSTGQAAGQAHLYIEDPLEFAYDYVDSFSDSSHESFGSTVAMSEDRIAIGAPNESLAGGNAVGLVYLYQFDGTQWLLSDILTSDEDGYQGHGLNVLIEGTTLFIAECYDDDGRVFVYDISNPKGASLLQELVPTGGPIGCRFGASMSAKDNHLFVGAPGYGSISDEGRVYTFRNPGNGYAQIDFVEPPETGTFHFGESISWSGARLVVGAPGTAAGGEVEVGTVFVFGSEGFEQRLDPPEIVGELRFGAAVSLRQQRIVVGSKGDHYQGWNSGSVTSWKRNNGYWAMQEQFRAALGEAKEEFGACLDQRSGVLVVGNSADGLENSTGGSVYAYEWATGGWVPPQNPMVMPIMLQHTELDNDMSEIGDAFGSSVDMSGPHAVVGSPWSDGRGQVYFYEGSGWEWDMTQELELPDEDGQLIGAAVAIDGDWSVVGVPRGQYAGGLVGGSAYLLEYDGEWNVIEVLADLETDAGLGASVALDRTARSYIAGAPGYKDQGGAIIADYKGSWVTTVLEPPTDGDVVENFGFDVDVLGDWAVVGAPSNENTGVLSKAYFYFRGTGGWELVQTINDPRPNATEEDGTYFAGRACFLSPDSCAIAAPLSSYSRQYEGIVYIFNWSGSAWEMEQIIPSPDPYPSNFFGVGLGTNRAGAMIIGAPFDDDLGTSTGSAFLFELVDHPRSGRAESWDPIARLLNTNLAAENYFGLSVAMDGGTAMVGFPMYMDENDPVSGGGEVGVYGDLLHSYWVGGHGGTGSWSDSENWVPSPPDSKRAAVFSLWPTTDEYTIQVDPGYYPIPAVGIVQTRVHLLLDGGGVQIGQEGVSPSMHILGDPGLGTTSMSISGDALELVDDLNLGSEGWSGIHETTNMDPDPLMVHGQWKQEASGVYDVTIMQDPQLPWPWPVISRETPYLSGTLNVQAAPAASFSKGDVIPLMGSMYLGGDLGTYFDLVSLPGLPEGLVFKIEYGPPDSGERPGGGTESVVTLVVESFSSLVGFDEPDEYGVTGYPTGMVLADLDGDAFDDIAVCVDGIPGQLHVFMNQGNGSFASQDIYTVGSLPMDVTAGDFNDDGIEDLAVTNFADDSVSIFHNDGSGSFSESLDSPMAVGAGPKGIAARDLDHDGVADLLICCSEDRAIEIYTGLNLRNGSREPAQKVDTPGKPEDIDPEDVVKPKFGNVGATTTEPDEIVTMAVGSDGSLSDPVGHPAGDDPGPITSDDVDGDGKDDFVVSNKGDGTITILKQSSTRGFEPPLTLPVGDTVGSLAVLDFEGDGDLDIAVVTEIDSDISVQLIRNDMNLYEGDQLVFSDGTPLILEVIPVLIDTSDIDGNGFDDLVTIGELPDHRRAGEEAPDSVMAVTTNSRCHADLNGDSTVDVLDLLVVIQEWGDCTGCSADIDGNGTVDVIDLLEVIAAWGICSS